MSTAPGQPYPRAVLLLPLISSRRMHGKLMCLQISSSGRVGRMKTHWGARRCCCSQKELFPTKDKFRENDSAPVSREPVGPGAISQAELLLQKSGRSLKKQLGSLEERREPPKVNEAHWAISHCPPTPRLPDPRSLMFSGLYMDG